MANRIGDDRDFHYSLYYPPNFDPTKKYPLLLEVYAGPAFSFVQDYYSHRWDFEWISSSYDVIVANFDPRGSGFRGNDIMHANYKNLGNYETLDQIEFADKISQQHDFIDEENMMVWGRSYGGYNTAKIMGRDSKPVFKCGMIVSAVTDWRYYHTIYTERYLQTPELNAEGYNSSTAIEKCTAKFGSF